MPVIDGRKSNIATDPIRNFKFLVNIQHQFQDRKFGTQNLATMGFMNMSGLAMTTEVIPYREGGNNTTQRKMPGQSNFSDITLSRGMVLGNTQPWAWTRQIFSANAGEGNSGPTTDFRARIDVKVMAHPVTATLTHPAYVKFRIYNAWISGIAYSELDAGGNAVYVQQMTITHEGFEMNMAKSLGENVAFR